MFCIHLSIIVHPSIHPFDLSVYPSNHPSIHPSIHLRFPNGKPFFRGSFYHGLPMPDPVERDLCTHARPGLGRVNSCYLRSYMLRPKQCLLFERLQGICDIIAVYIILYNHDILRRAANLRTLNFFQAIVVKSCKIMATFWVFEVWLAPEENSTTSPLRSTPSLLVALQKCLLCAESLGRSEKFGSDRFWRRKWSAFFGRTMRNHWLYDSLCIYNHTIEIDHRCRNWQVDQC